MYNFSFLLLFSFVNFTKKCGKLLGTIEGTLDKDSGLKTHFVFESFDALVTVNRLK